MPKIIYNNVIPFPGYAAVNLFGVIFVRRGSRVTRRLINHEAIHTAQMRETLFLGFYIWYLLEFLVKLLLCLDWDRAYRSVSFEREAYANDGDVTWPGVRDRWRWARYVFKLYAKQP